MMDLVIFEGFFQVVHGVALALVPLIIILLIFQFVLRLDWEEIKRVLIGVALSFVGLALFLQGVNVGFLPIGSLIGEYIGKLDYNWVSIPIGLLLGLVTIMAEPSVRVLAYEVEEVSGGFVKQKTLTYTLAIGVAVSVALAMTKILYGIPLLYILIPGYVIALILAHFSSSTFVSLAFDSGGVATGPMTVTFIMAMAVGVATGIEGRDPLLDGFGLVAITALAPVLSVLSLGFILGGKKVSGEDQ